MNPPPRVRGAPNGAEGGAAGRRGHAPTGSASSAGISRAEKFENEKQRIIDSCFNKREDDGSLAESYITHIRVVEDAASPSAPPPPNAPPENKKSRAIIVAVRRSGRVRLHKARENGNGTFSIGKTWVLDHLSAIESFTGVHPTSFEQQQRKEWATNTGMVVTIQKPYFWQTETPKEKDFFISSLVKIYRKYTGGKEPLLSGFTSRELAEMGVQSAGPKASPASINASRSGTASSEGQRSASMRREPSRRRERSSEGRSDPRAPSASSSAPRKVESPDPRHEVNEPSPKVPDSRRPKGEVSGLSRRLSRLESSPALAARDDRSTSGRTLETASSVESLQNRGDVQTPSSSYAHADRPRPVNGSQSPLTKVDTPGRQPPAPGPRSPDRPVSFQGGRLPERRRPPLEGFPQGGLESPVRTPTDERAPRGHLRRSSVASSVNSHAEPPKSAFDYFGVRAQNGISPDAGSNTSVSPNDMSSLPATPSEEVHRPGLGPMIKKRKEKELTGVVRKVVNAHNAFKPRHGGAADRFRQEPSPQTSSPDGIHGVFKASSRDQRPRLAAPPSTDSLATTVDATKSRPLSRDQLSVAGDAAKPSVLVPYDEDLIAPDEIPGAMDEADDHRAQRPMDNAARYAKALDIDLSMIEGRTIEIDAVLSDFGWATADKGLRSFDELQTDIKRDLARMETGAWLGGFEQTDERVTAVEALIDKAIDECEELDGLLTLYNVELGTLREDVAYIEAQSQGLQVQTANQRLLHNELRNLLDTISFPPQVLKALKDAPLSRAAGIADVENALMYLYKAMLTIDPRARAHGRSGAESNRMTMTDHSSVEISTMRAVQEHKDGYRSECLAFIQRLRQYLEVKFAEGEAQVQDLMARYQIPPGNTPKTDMSRYNQTRDVLSMYAPLILFSREIDASGWEQLLERYEASRRRIYQEEFGGIIEGWKREVRHSPDDPEALFTTQEKEGVDSLVARKLTVRRNKTLRGDGGRHASGDKAHEGRVHGYEAFAGMLADTSQVIYLEQNFVVELFWLSSLNFAEFTDVVVMNTPDQRRKGDLDAKKYFDPDRAMAKRLKGMIDGIYTSWPGDLQSFVDWILGMDPLQGVGVMFALEFRISELEDSNQEFVVQTLGSIHSRLTTRFDRFVDDQIRHIEETKVKIKKRKGVISFFKTFPYFAATVEAMLAHPRAQHFEIRHLVDDVYIKINKAMFESLKFIAKESPAVMASQKGIGAGVGLGGMGADAEDKAILNYYILLIENMHHYLESVDARNNAVLKEWKGNALREMTEHMDLYLNLVVRRPLGKLLEFLESTESLVVAAAATNQDPASINERPSHAPAVFRKLLSTYDSRETFKGIDALRKRVTKHFGEADDPSLSQSLIAKILRECAERYGIIHDRVQRVCKEVYRDEMHLEWRREEAMGQFRKA